MQISAANIGQVICLEHRSQLIQIEDVSDNLVTYRNEIGHRSATPAHHLFGSVVQDPARIQEFERNFTLGHSLNAAEQSALRKYLSAHTQDHETRREAKEALESIRSQQAHLEKRVEARNFHMAREPEKTEPRRGRLDSLIAGAQTRAGTEQTSRGAPTRSQPEQEEFSR